MTVAALPSVAIYQENGASAAFAAPFRFKSADDLIVDRLPAAGGVVALALGVDYTVTGGTTDEGGTVTLAVPGPAGGRLRIRRETGRAQPMVYTTDGRFPAKSHEEALDRVTLVTQELDDAVADVDRRAITLPDGEQAPVLPPALGRAGGVLTFDPTTGAPLVKPEALLAPGATGASDNTYTTLAAFKASDIARLTASLVGVANVPDGRFNLTLGDFTALVDDRDYIASNQLSAAAGAWVRQRAEGIAAADGRSVQAGLDAVPFASSAPANLTLSPRPNIRFNAAMDAARAAGVLRVTVVGNSIPEGAGISYANTYAENLQQLLQLELPGVQIILTNLSIGGRNLSQLASGSYVAPGDFVLAAPTGVNSSYWPGGSTNGKTWRDHVRDSTPDLIVLEEGENSGIDTVAFNTALETFETYSQSWTKKPWFVLVSSLVPEGIEPNRQDKQAFADLLHFTAIQRGYGHIDANAWYRLMRDGKRRNLVPAYEEASFAGWGDPAKWGYQGSFSLAGGVLTGSGRAERQIVARDFGLVDYFTLGSNDAVFLCEARRRPGTNDVWKVQTAFADQGDSNGGAIRIYFRDELKAFARFPAKTAGQSVRIRIKFLGPMILVWHDNVLQLTYWSTLGLYAGAFAIGTAAGSGSHAQFKAAIAPEFEAAPVGYFGASYLLNDALHHPSDDGAFQTYIPAMRQFVSEFVAAWLKPIPGRVTLVAGTVTVPAAIVGAATDIRVDRQTDGGTVGASYSVARTPGTGFTITAKDGAGATQAADTSVVRFEIAR